MKNNLLCTLDLKIVCLSSTFNGHVHDKKICEIEPLNLPIGIRLWQDTGFQEYYPYDVTVYIQKNKGKDLSKKQKKENKRIPSIRIKVEHGIGGVKICRIVKERIRCYKFGFEYIVMLLACGLHNFRISQKISLIEL